MFRSCSEIIPHFQRCGIRSDVGISVGSNERIVHVPAVRQNVTKSKSHPVIDAGRLVVGLFQGPIAPHPVGVGLSLHFRGLVHFRLLRHTFQAIGEFDGFRETLQKVTAAALLLFMVWRTIAVTTRTSQIVVFRLELHIWYGTVFFFMRSWW